MNGFISVSGIGNHNRATYYNVKIDHVVCGCFTGTLKEFKEKVTKVYGGCCPTHKRYYAEYMAAIEFFEKCRKAAWNFELRE